MSEHRARIEQNLSRIRARIDAAARGVGRDPASVTLVAVTKYVNLELTRALVLAGCHDLGESRPQELWQKAEALRDLNVRWHLVGHLQRNKVRRSLPSMHLLHSTDSLRLLDELQKEAAGQELTCTTLLEVNVSGDASKHGLAPAELRELLPQLHRFPRVHVAGLMTMAALERQGEEARVDFRALSQLRSQLVAEHPELQLTELSMGMSSDFEVAIEEGATIVRVGSALFEGIVDED